MTRPAAQYVRELHKRFSYWPTWLPNERLKLGDVGILEGERFSNQTTLDELGIAYKSRKSSEGVDFTYTSAAGVTVRAQAKGELNSGTPANLGQAGVSIEFGSAGAFLFQASGCTVDELVNKASIGRGVFNLVREGTWERNWVVVDTLVRADCATIVLSRSNKGSIELTAAAPVTAADLAKLDAGLSVHRQSGDLVRFVAAQGLSPLYRVSRVKRSLISRLLGESGHLTFGGAPPEEPGDPIPEEEVLERVSPD